MIEVNDPHHFWIKCLQMTFVPIQSLLQDGQKCKRNPNETHSWHLVVDSIIIYSFNQGLVTCWTNDPFNWELNSTDRFLGTDYLNVYSIFLQCIIIPYSQLIQSSGMSLCDHFQKCMTWLQQNIHFSQNMLLCCRFWW